MDYPLGADIYELMASATAKTICMNFDEQLDAVEHLYGQHIKFNFTSETVEELIAQEALYPDYVKQRVLLILLEQLRKYRYLF